MELLKGIFAEDLFLYIQDHKTFIISDIHIGYEESLNRQGILIPRNNYNDLILRLERSLEHIKKKDIIETIIINGDLIHEFGKISKKEKELVNRFINFLSNYANLIIIKGNHDNSLKYIVDKDIEIIDKVLLGKTLIIHGDKLAPKESLRKIDTIIIGHEHPAISIQSGSRIEKFKCFLKGKYERKNLIVMPSCNLFIEGTDVLREKLLSPFLKNLKIRDFEAYIIEDKLYDFGKIKNLIQ